MGSCGYWMVAVVVLHAKLYKLLLLPLNSLWTLARKGVRVLCCALLRTRTILNGVFGGVHARVFKKALWYVGVEVSGTSAEGGSTRASAMRCGSEDGGEVAIGEEECSRKLSFEDAGEEQRRVSLNGERERERERGESAGVEEKGEGEGNLVKENCREGDLEEEQERKGKEEEDKAKEEEEEMLMTHHQMFMLK